MSSQKSVYQKTPKYKTLFIYKYINHSIFFMICKAELTSYILDNNMFILNISNYFACILVYMSIKVTSLFSHVSPCEICT